MSTHKKLIVLSFIVLMFVFASSLVFAQRACDFGGKAQAAEAKGVVEVGNTVCPVSGEKIEAGETVKAEYGGKTYSFCCKMCVKDFKKNPEKYIAALKAHK